jgi:hypothetical protein
MINLREFVRAMALMTDKLQLVVSTDVNRVAPSAGPGGLATASPEQSLSDMSGGKLPLLVSDAPQPNNWSRLVFLCSFGPICLHTAALQAGL